MYGAICPQTRQYCRLDALSPVVANVLNTGFANRGLVLDLWMVGHELPRFNVPDTEMACRNSEGMPINCVHWGCHNDCCCDRSMCAMCQGDPIFNSGKAREERKGTLEMVFDYLGTNELSATEQPTGATGMGP